MGEIWAMVGFTLADIEAEQLEAERMRASL